MLASNADFINCDLCQQSFRPTQANQKFCSPKCRRKIASVRQQNKIISSIDDRFTDAQKQHIKVLISLRMKNRQERIEQFPDKLTEEQFQVIVGSTLGDGMLHLNQPPNGDAHFELSHCEAQKEYLQWKDAFLKPFVTQSAAPKYNKRFDLTEYRSRTVSLPLFTKLYHQFYVQNRKTVPLDLVNNLDELGLAILYQDDGTFDFHAHISHICTFSFTYEENQILQTVMQKNFNLTSKIRNFKLNNGNRVWGLTFGVKETQHLFDIVRPHIHPVMIYKISDKLKKTHLAELANTTKDDL